MWAPWYFLLGRGLITYFLSNKLRGLHSARAPLCCVDGDGHVTPRALGRTDIWLMSHLFLCTHIKLVNMWSASKPFIKVILKPKMRSCLRITFINVFEPLQMLTTIIIQHSFDIAKLLVWYKKAFCRVCALHVFNLLYSHMKPFHQHELFKMSSTDFLHC